MATKIYTICTLDDVNIKQSKDIANKLSVDVSGIEELTALKNAIYANRPIGLAGHIRGDRAYTHRPVGIGL